MTDGFPTFIKTENLPEEGRKEGEMSEQTTACSLRLKQLKDTYLRRKKDVLT